jgi:GH15 family glucan-1,4-alpha-glucosidase
VLFVLEHRDDHDRIHPLYNVGGRHLPPEAEIAELAGYAGSRPVRIGNAADRQVQLDVSGPIIELALLLYERGAPLSARHWQLVETLVGTVAHRWREPDHGIWEIRKAPRHHVYSKAMCWYTVDRAIAISDHVLGRVRPDWVVLRDEIRDDLLTNGWKDDVGSFTSAYDGADLDASVLVLTTCGLLDRDDERLEQTVRSIETELRAGPTVYRYHADDGLPGREGGFNLMTSWLIDALDVVGRRDDALALLDELVTLAGPTGLLAEEYDPETGRALGNHPQAYSHLGLINNALRLSDSL